MAKKKDKPQKPPQPVKEKKESSKPLDFVKETLTLLGGLAGSILAIYGLVKIFTDDTEGFVWLIPVGVVIWLIILWQLFQVRKTTAYSLLIISVLIGVIWWMGWQSQIKATEDKVIVLVAQFDGPEDKYGLHEQIMEDLRQATKGYNDTVIIDGKEVVTAGLGSAYARELGQKAKADLVIWAWYRPTENPNLTIHFENLVPLELETFPESEIYTPQSTLAQLESFEVQKQLGSETGTLIMFLTAFLRYKVGEYEVALTRFNNILAQGNTSTFIKPETLYFYVGTSQYMLGMFEQSIDSYNKAIEGDPAFINAYGNRGNAYAGLKQYLLAVTDYQKVIELNPYDAMAYHNLGLAESYMYKYDNAIENMNKAIELDSKYANAYIDRGYVFNMVGQYENAIKDFDQAILLNPDSSISYNNRGLSYAGLQQYERAIEDYSKAISLFANFTNAYLNRGVAYDYSGHYEEALRDYGMVISLDPQDIAAYVNRGIVYMKLGQHKLAFENFNEAIEINPSEPETYYNRGYAYGLLEEYAQAINDYDKVIEIDPQNSDAYYNRGLAHQKLGETVEAEADFKKYEELTGQKP